MITHTELVQARELLLERTVSFFAEQPDVLGILLAGSLPAGTADAYSDIDLRIIATPEGQVRLLKGRLDWPTNWGDLLFNAWLDGTQHCVSHFRPFLKIDVFYWTPAIFRPSPWFALPRFVPPTEFEKGFSSADYADQYCYVASEWTGPDLQRPTILFERYH